MAAAKLNPDRLAREMMLRGWHGIDLAYFAGVSPATVSAALQGRQVSTTTLRKMALALSGSPTVPGVEDLLQAQ